MHGTMQNQQNRLAAAMHNYLPYCFVLALMQMHGRCWDLSRNADNRSELLSHSSHHAFLVASCNSAQDRCPHCYMHKTACCSPQQPWLFLQTWTQATTYLQLIGILIGQMGFGILGDWIGRKVTMLIDISVILLGIILLTVSNGTTINGWVIMYAWAQFIFGVGIGGEYPMTSTRATEESEENRQYAQRHRGRKVMLAYTMQGWGQFVNLSVLLLLLNIFNQ